MSALSQPNRQRLLTIIQLLEHYELTLRSLESQTTSVEDQNALAASYGYLQRAAGILRGRFVP